MSAMSSPFVVKELWVYPVKACCGVSVDSAVVTPTGLELDRAFCIVDVHGVNVAAREAISQRKLPILATVIPTLSADGGTMTLNAPGMPPLAIPTRESAYAAAETITVECSGRSTTHAESGGWRLGSILCKEASHGSQWISDYLNREGPDGRRISGKKQAAKYALCRSVASLSLEDYPPEFPVIARAKTDRDYAERFRGNRKVFADFAPLLIVSDASAVELGRMCASSSSSDAQKGVTAYPTRSFRGNVIVGGATLAPWEEETWRVIAVAGVVYRKIKECPRCTVPCRNQLTGDYLFPADKLKLWTVLKKAFPQKYNDAEWGSWAGAYMGVYFGNGGRTGVLRVGDTIDVEESDAQSRGIVAYATWTAGLALAAAIFAAAVHVARVKGASLLVGPHAAWRW